MKSGTCRGIWAAVVEKPVVWTVMSVYEKVNGYKYCAENPFELWKDILEEGVWLKEGTRPGQHEPNQHERGAWTWRDAWSAAKAMLSSPQTIMSGNSGDPKAKR